jgi:hypothetical protein
MEQEISSKTIMILVVLTVIITLLSTWTVLYEVNNVKTKPTANINNPVASGQVMISVSQPPEPVSASGEIRLEKIA